MPIAVRVLWNEGVFEPYSVRQVRRMRKGAMEKIGIWWHQEILPEHFRMATHSKYPTQERSTRYKKRKRRLGRSGHVRKRGEVPNVFSGESERALTSNASILAFPSRVTVKMIGPPYMLMRPYKSGQPNKGEEITTLLPSELNTAAEMLTKEINDEMNKLSRTQVSRMVLLA